MIIGKKKRSIINLMNSRKRIPNLKSAFGLDFGYTNDPSALFCLVWLIWMPLKSMCLMKCMKKLYRTKAIYQPIHDRGYAKENQRADSC